MKHAVHRTSPKGPGQKFIGRCVNCGATDLPASAALDDCPNLRGVTQDEAVIEAITGEPAERDDPDPGPDELDDEDMAGEECGRWINGRLGKHCSKAGSEECDWICPYSR